MIVAPPKDFVPMYLMQTDSDISLRTDVIVFIKDRIVSIRGENLLQAINHHTTHADRKAVEDLLERPIAETMPVYIRTFIQPIFDQTMQGKYLQLITMGVGGAYRMWRTFPITTKSLDKRKVIIAGVLVISPVPTEFINVNKFAVGAVDSVCESTGTPGTHSSQPSANDINGIAGAGPPHQLMQPNHSGIIRTD